MAAQKIAQTQLGLGLAALGRPEYINVLKATPLDKSFLVFKQHAFDMMDAAYQNGIRYYDTAPSYGRGEEFLLEWNRLHQYSDVDLSTKWGYTYVADWEIGYTGAHEIKEHSHSKLEEQWAVSKDLLPNLKVYQIHSATFDSGVLANDEVIGRLHSLKKSVDDLKIGLTSSGPNQKDLIAHSLDITKDGEAVFDSFQVTYNVLEQGPAEILKTLRAAGKFVIIKEALANGRIFSEAGYPSLHKKLAALALKYSVGEDAIALRFVVDSVLPDVVLSGATSTSQLLSNLQCLGFSLDPEELDSLRAEAVESDSYWEERKQLEWT